MAEKVICEIVSNDRYDAQTGYFNVIQTDETRRYYGPYDDLLSAVKELPYDYFRAQIDGLQEENSALKRYNG
jgi:hypothetical protein